ncbi:alpha-galactosidase [Lacticaseibacillus zhaodongensis]|uniref:alpha-galactosidase n=1 Tax=Lacticaseibacillus zhaodongensis TaxID=2668065 RepID=UPI0012D2D829|nr:alpha-galactosidase [Lacticaseibacillus zhaodongensis]
MIHYDKQRQIFTLQNKQISYIIQLIHGYPVKRYFGPRLKAFNGSARLEDFNHAFAVASDASPYSMTTLPFEYSTSGTGDYRTPGYQVNDGNNQLIPPLRYASHRIISGSGKQPIDLPQLRNAADNSETLIITLQDQLSGLQLNLQYTILNNLPTVVRNVRFSNHGKDTLILQKAASLQLELDDDELQALYLTGTHAHEANVQITALSSGEFTISSNSGASGPQAVPFLGLCEPAATQFNGNVLGVTLLWSGDWKITATVDQYQRTRVTAGVNPETFSWRLPPETEFSSPLAVLSFATDGFNGLSQAFHSFFNNYIIPNQKPKLLAYNTWESSYFKVNANTVEKQLPALKRLGVELVVVDDGWFINRNGEDGQLGDWIVDSIKFPSGLTALAQECHQSNLRFGVWVEPEMVTQNSNLYQQHPDWVLQYLGRDVITSRNQLVLDLSRQAVQTHLIETLTNLISTNSLDYLKWDYNRHFTQPGSSAWPAVQQGEVSFRYMTGLYHVLRVLRTRFPELIIENCSAGGGRLDGGMLYYTDQTWVSDLSDSVLRMETMDGFSLLFPPSIFVSHITPSPNEQDYRLLPLRTRMLLSSVGISGLECPPESLTKDEQDQIAEFFQQYKIHRQFNQYGHLYRLTTWPHREHEVAWLVVNTERTLAICLWSAGVVSPVHRNRRESLHYLNPNVQYLDSNHQRFFGDELNLSGITLPQARGDFDAARLTFTKADDK